ncbi:methionine/alanine import family NSS transporter small subunit [Streptomyces thermoalcalitolerans]|uniref:Methionine/alanine importer small subunit n=1 Tax=Streptomyces thermoalcalitolerans TaxID=65605 RepID=A0ABN1NGX5_9ACTN
MSASAIIMLIVAIVIVWGGLVGAVVQLRRHPEQPEDDTAPTQPTA